MKYILVVFFCSTFFKATAQKAVSNIDTVYYILDTASTLLKDRMWDIGIESRYKYFTIKCPCFKYGNEPTFVYDAKKTGQRHDKNFVSKLSTVSLSKLIELAKKATDLSAQTLYMFYLIEKTTDYEYSIHKTRLLIPRKREASIDYENVPAKEK